MKPKFTPRVVLGIVLVLAALAGRCADGSPRSEAELLKKLFSGKSRTNG